MEIKNTRHKAWALKELTQIAKASSVSAKEPISVDSLIRLAVYNLIIENSKTPLRASTDSIAEISNKAWKISEKTRNE